MTSNARSTFGMRQFRLFNLFGFEVKLDISWLLLGLLISWSLGAGYFPTRYPDLPSAAYAWMGIAVAIGVPGAWIGSRVIGIIDVAVAVSVHPEPPKSAG